jgi:hypothetical protein
MVYVTQIVWLVFLAFTPLCDVYPFIAGRTDIDNAWASPTAVKKTFPNATILINNVLRATGNITIETHVN